MGVGNKRGCGLLMKMLRVKNIWGFNFLLFLILIFIKLFILVYDILLYLLCFYLIINMIKILF